MKRALFSIVFLSILVSFIFYTLRPVPSPNKDNTKLKELILKNVEFNEQTKDIFFQFDGVDQKYYINRGIEKGLKKSVLNSLVGKRVILKYIDYFSFLKIFSKTHPVSELKFKDMTLFSITEE